jgi:probable rRNA maturation factor
MLSISITNEQVSVPVDEDRLAGAVREVLAGEGLAAGTVSVAIVDDETIHRLNRQFLNHDFPTDVLSFVLSEGDSSLDGEIVVSAETADSVAQRFDWNTADELLLYVVHGALHLTGYDDRNAAQQAEMRGRERHYLGRFGVVPSGDASADHPVRY